MFLFSHQRQKDSWLGVCCQPENNSKQRSDSGSSAVSSLDCSFSDVGSVSRSSLWKSFLLCSKLGLNVRFWHVPYSASEISFCLTSVTRRKLCTSIFYLQGELLEHDSPSASSPIQFFTFCFSQSSLSFSLSRWVFGLQPSTLHWAELSSSSSFFFSVFCSFIFKLPGSSHGAVEKLFDMSDISIRERPPEMWTPSLSLTHSHTSPGPTPDWAWRSRISVFIRVFLWNLKFYRKSWARASLLVQTHRTVMCGRRCLDLQWFCVWRHLRQTVLD